MIKEEQAEKYHHEIKLLQEDIAAWSYRRYGNNRSEIDGHNLESLAPLLGVITKLGKLEKVDSEAEIIVCIEDIFLYLCDFASREDVEITHIGFPRRNKTKNIGLIGIGRLAGLILYSHRNLISEDKYKLDLVKGVNELIIHLDEFISSKGFGIDLIVIFRSAWQKISEKKK